MTQPATRDDFEVALSGLDAPTLEVILEVARTLKAAQDADDDRPPEVILGPVLARAGIDWPAKEDDHDRRTV